MKTKTPDSLFSTVCFALLNILLLAFNFSVWGCIPVAATVVYLLIRLHGMTTLDDSQCSITAWLGEYIGVTVLDAVLIYACERNIFKSGLVHEFESPMIWAVIIMAAGFCVSRFILNSYADLYAYRYILRYITVAAGAVGSSFLCIKWNLTAIVCIGVIAVAVALIVDMLAPPRSASGYHWLCVVSIVFALCAIAYPQFTCELVDMVFNYRAHTAAPIPAYIAVAALFAVCAVQLSVTKKPKADTGAAARVYVFLAATTVMWMLTELVSTPYDAVFLLLMLAVQLLFLLGQRADRTVTVGGVALPVLTLQHVVLSAMMLVLPVMFYYGLVWEYGVAMVATLGIYIFYAVTTTKKADAVPVYKTWLFWQLILTAALVYGMVVAYNQCHFASGYVFLLLVYVAATLALLTLNIENKQLKKNHSAMRIAIAAAMSLVLIFAADQVHTTVTYEVDNALSSKAQLDPATVGETDTITVTVKKDKDNPLKKCYAYWTDDKETIIAVSSDKDADNVLPFRDGALCVVCEYESGVITTDTQWFYDADHMAKAIHVGSPRFPIGGHDNDKDTDKDADSSASDAVTTTTAKAP